jgi:hypothetical protein
MYCVPAVRKMIKNTHRHPANRALHCIGAPFYAIGAAITLGHFAGMQADIFVGLVMWIAAIAMFVAGHKIEGNAGSTTLVLFFQADVKGCSRFCRAASPSPAGLISACS